RTSKVQRMLPLLCSRAYAASRGIGHLFKNFRQRPHRNPRVIPHPKVKAFRVREWHKRDPDAVAIFESRWASYEMQLNALQQAFYYELHGRLLLPGERASDGLHKLGSQEDQLADSAETKRQVDEAERINADWNARSAELRVDEMRRQLDELRNEHDRLQLDSELADQAAVLSFQARLKRDLEQAGDFIDESNLDAKIEAILDSPIVDFNFAIDPAGNMIRGVVGSAADSVPEPPEPPSPDELSVRV
ncbi:hypothetical protein BOX15_Mlig028805g1, partial [Macrostomum lignano]